MKNAELKSLEQRAPRMTLEDLDKLAKELRSLVATVSSEQRKRRGQRRPGVLGVNGRTYS